MASDAVGLDDELAAEGDPDGAAFSEDVFSGGNCVWILPALSIIRIKGCLHRGHLGLNRPAFG